MYHLIRKQQLPLAFALAVALGLIGFAGARYAAAVTFSGTVSITGGASVVGSLSKGSGTFVIDHPLDPANKLLFHSFVESPDVKNIYDGVVTLNSRGEATVRLPNYWSALNEPTTARFLLTPIGQPAPGLFVTEAGIVNNSFTIAGGPAGARVSWQVTGIRHDPYILANPIKVEVEKGPDELVDKGEYLFEGYENPYTRAAHGLWERITGFVSGVWGRIAGLFGGV